MMLSLVACASCLVIKVMWYFYKALVVDKRLANIILQVFVVIWILVSAVLVIVMLMGKSEGGIFVQALASLILSTALLIYIRKKV